MLFEFKILKFYYFIFHILYFNIKVKDKRKTKKLVILVNSGCKFCLTYAEVIILNLNKKVDHQGFPLIK